VQLGEYEYQLKHAELLLAQDRVTHTAKNIDIEAKT